MSWLQSVGIGVLNALLCCLGAGVVASVGATWHRMSTREGASAYFIIAMGLVGLVAGLVIGVICARVVAGSPVPGFWRGWGLSAAVSVGLLACVTGYAWLAADFPPTLHGKPLELQVEIRCPAGYQPASGEETARRAYLIVTADSGRRSQQGGELLFARLRQEAGRAILPGVVALHTSDPGKSVGVVLSDADSQYFRPPLPGRPTKADLSWSPWLEQPTRADLAPVPPGEAMALRYRVQPQGSGVATEAESAPAGAPEGAK